MSGLTDAEIVRLTATCGEFLERGFVGDFTPLMLRALNELQRRKANVMLLREALQAMLDEDDGGMAADDAREALEISA